MTIQKAFSLDFSQWKVKKLVVWTVFCYCKTVKLSETPPSNKRRSWIMRKWNKRRGAYSSKYGIHTIRLRKMYIFAKQTLPHPPPQHFSNFSFLISKQWNWKTIYQIKNSLSTPKTMLYRAINRKSSKSCFTQ